MNKHKICFYLSVALWAAVIIWLLIVPVKSSDEVEPQGEQQEIVCINSVYDKPAEEPETYEDWFRKNAERIDDCEITHYCVELRPHICGTGDGITSTEVPVTPGWTCAVDPEIIPYGCEVMVDYGNHVAFYKAQDTGGAIKGNHIDLAVESHLEALENGVLTATVYFMEVEREFN